MFEDYSSFLHQNFPKVNVIGDNFPPPRPRQILASVISTLKLVLMGLVIFGDHINIWQTLGITPPPIYIWANQNKMYACVMLFFICNTIESQLISTGAFEISYNDMPIWSKLQSGRLPNPNELFQIVDNQVKFTAPSQQF